MKTFIKFMAVAAVGACGVFAYFAWTSNVSASHAAPLSAAPSHTAPFSAVPSWSATDVTRQASESVVAPPGARQDVISPEVMSGITSAIDTGTVLSPDGTRWAAIVTVGKPEADEDPQKIAAMVDGKQGPTYDLYAQDPGVQFGALIFSPDSKRFAYSVMDGASGNAIVTVDGVQGEGYFSASDVEFSPDGKHLAYIAEGDHGPMVVTDGVEGPHFQDVGTFAFSPDGKRFAYSAQNNDDTWAVVADGHQGAPWDEIGQHIVFSPDSTRLAYVGNRTLAGNRTAQVVADGHAGKFYADIGYFGEVLTPFSPDSRHLIYAAEVAPGKWTVVVDEKEGKVYDAWSVYNALFSPDSKHFAYVVQTAAPTAKEPGVAFAVVDGQEGKRYSGAMSMPMAIAFSPDSKHIAYVLHVGDRSGTSFVIVDDTEGKHYDQVQDLTFSPDGSQLAYVACTGSFPDRNCRAVVNGAEGTPYDEIGKLVFSPDGKYLTYAAHKRQSAKWVVVANGKEGKAYDYISPRTAYIGPNTRLQAGPRVVFDSPNQFNYVAREGDNLLRVTEKLAATHGPQAK